MIDDNLREELIEQLDDMEVQLDKYDEAQKIFEQWNKSWLRWKYWIIASTLTVFCQIGAALYEMTLPGNHYLSIPFFACFILTMIGIQIPLRETRVYHQMLEAIRKQSHDEYYTMVTGQKRH